MKVLGIPVPDMIMKLCKPAQVYLILSLVSLTLYVISLQKQIDETQKKLVRGSLVLIGIVMFLTFLFVGLGQLLLNFP